MERLIARLTTAREAIATLDELLQKRELSKVERDAAIQRFEYSCEAVWKTVQLYLREVEGLDVGSPKSAARSSFQIGLLDDAETRRALTMADDRNLTVHTYNEKLAEAIAARLNEHVRLLRHWIEEVAARVASAGEGR
jgi:nucleotidyltransferase substrate binding protein (TIGR01987 family)